MSKAGTIHARQNRIKTALIEQLRRLPVREIAYEKVGVTRMTVSRWRRASKKFSEEMDAAIGEGYEFICGMAESQLISLARQGKFEALRFILQHNSPRYANKLELSGSIQTKEAPMTKAEKALRLQALNHSSLPYGQSKKKQ